MTTRLRNSKKLKLRWSCSNMVEHTHKWKFMAYICGRIQYAWFKIKGSGS